MGLREIKFIPGFTKNPNGSVLASFGNTMVLCTVMVEDGVPNFISGMDRGWLSAEYSMLPGSTFTRKLRSTASGRLDSRSTEIQRLIGRSLRMALDFDLLGERTIYVDCDVLQADGGTRTTAISGAFLALKIAMEDLIEKGIIHSNPIIRNIAAVSVGKFEKKYLIDLDFSKDSNAKVDMNIIMDDKKNLIEIQGTAEKQVFSIEEMNEMVEIAWDGIEEIIKEQERVFDEYCNSNRKCW